MDQALRPLTRAARPGRFRATITRARRQEHQPPRADVRGAGGGREPDHRAARGRGRAAHRGGDAGARRGGGARRRGASGGWRAAGSAGCASRRTCSTWAIRARRRGCCAACWRRTTSFAVMTGDASLRRRPMRRVTEPLALAGRSSGRGRAGGCRLRSSARGIAMPIEYRLPVASAQVKSALLLAGLNAPGWTRVEEPEPTRDHTERMLRHFGAEVAMERGRAAAGSRALRGQPELRAADVVVPGDPSSAAFRAGGGGAGAGVGGDGTGGGAEPGAHRAVHDAARDGRGSRDRRTSGWRAARIWAT